jgi:hypothetical protein
MKKQRKTIISSFAIAIFTVLFAMSDAYGDLAVAHQRFLVLTSDSDEISVKMFQNIQSILKTARLNFTTLNAGSYELGKHLDALNKSDDLVVVVTPNLTEINLFSPLIDYVNKGGKVFFAAGGTGDSPLQGLLGVEEFIQVETLSGLDPKLNIFPGMNKMHQGVLAFRSYSSKVRLADGTRVIIEAEKNLPLAWTYRFGKGEVLVFNSNRLSEYTFCGLFIQLCSMLNDYFVSTIFNAKVVFIDDFPSPIPSGSEFSILSNYDGRSYEEFFRDIWWPDIKAMGKKYDVKYTCLALGNYENSVKMPPIPISEQMRENIKYYGNDLLANGDELGIHGFNHASLLMSDYKKALYEIGYTPWNSIDDMVTSLSKLREVLREILGPREYFTYVPPMNMMSKAGKEAVLKVFPHIRCFAGLGDPFYEESGVLHQEIGPDPDFPQVYALPRFSSGHLYKSEDMYFIFSHLAAFGLLSHFVHPDDILDPERSYNKPWQEMYEDISRKFREVHEKLPFLRGMTTKDFVTEQFKLLNIAVYANRQGNIITINYSRDAGTMYHYLRLNNGMTIKSITNGKARLINDAGVLFMIEGHKSPVTITLESTERTRQ